MLTLFLTDVNTQIERLKAAVVKVSAPNYPYPPLNQQLPPSLSEQATPSFSAATLVNPPTASLA